MKKYLQVFSGGFSNLEVDIEKLKEITAWKPEILLEESIKEIVSYWRKYGRNNKKL